MMAAMDDGLMAPSDAELDSEVDDTDAELDLGSWSMQASAGPSCFRRESSTWMMSAASKGAFEPSLDNNGVITVDFDSILSDLCDLEHQLDEQSILNAASPTAAIPVLPVPSTLKKSSDNSLIFKDYTNLKSTSPHKVLHNSATTGAIKKQNQTQIGSELDFALSELSTLVGSAFDVGGNSELWSSHDGQPNSAPSDLKDTYKNNRFQCTQNARGSNSANNNVHTRSNSMEHHPRKGSSTILFGGGVPQNPWHEHLSDGGQNDSAFDDNVSLPSSGSHVSMATSSRSSGSSITNSVLGLSNEMDEAQRSHDPAKANSHSNLNKVFVRVYSPEGSSESVLVTERMTVSQVVDILLTKSHVQLNMSWSLVEQLPNLLMERLLEDNECVNDNILTWTKDSENKLVLVERPDKYDVFLCPEKYLTTTEDKNKKCDENVRKVLIQEFLESNCRLPEFDGMLYIKLEGKKAWKKLYFILRASGIYYNPKGKSKSLIELVCLQKLDLVEVYTGIGWKKKYKAPNDFGFALKHPQIQKKTPKYIKYLCAEDVTSMWHWINRIRLAKYGLQLYTNFHQWQSTLNNFHIADDSISKKKQAALIQEKISEMFCQQSQSVPSFSCVALQSPSSLQTFRSESPDDSPSRLLKSCLEANGTAPARMTPLIPITTQITKQLSGQQTMRSPIKVQPRSPKKVVKETSNVQLPPPPQVTSDSIDALADRSLPQPPSHEMLHRSMDQLCSSGSSTFNTMTNQKTLKMAPAVNTGKWGTSQKHAVIKRTASIGHKEIEDSPLPCPQICPLSPKPVPSTAPSEVIVPSPNSLPPIRRKFPSSSSFSDCDEGRMLRTPQSSPKPKPPLPPKRKDILKPSPSVDSSPTKGRVAAIAGSLNLARKPIGDVRPSSASSSQQSLSPKSPPPGRFTMKPSPSCESWQTASFLMDLQRVISQKQACGVGGFTDVAAASRNSCSVDFDSLPPPPAALLEGLKNLKKSNRPPPPPKRSQETHLTYK